MQHMPQLVVQIKRLVPGLEAPSRHFADIRSGRAGARKWGSLHFVEPLSHPFGIAHLDMPVTPEKLRRAIRTTPALPPKRLGT